MNGHELLIGGIPAMVMNLLSKIMSWVDEWAIA